MKSFKKIAGIQQYKAKVEERCMNCRACGREIRMEDAVCPFCGAPTESPSDAGQPVQGVSAPEQQVIDSDFVWQNPSEGYAPQPAVAGYEPPPAAPAYSPQPAGAGYGPPPAAPAYAPPPAGAGYGPQPAAPGYGPPPVAPGYGPQPAGVGYGQPPAASVYGPQLADAGYGPQPAAPVYGPQVSADLGKTVKGKLFSSRFWLGALSGALIVAIVAGVLFGTGILGSPGGKIEGSGYISAEAAAKAYLSAFSSADLDGMVETFAVETYVDNFNTIAYVNSTYDSISIYNIYLPSGGEFSNELNAGRRRGYILDNIHGQCMGVLMGGWQVDDNHSYDPQTDKGEHGYTDKDTLGRMRSLKIIEAVSHEDMGDNFKDGSSGYNKMAIYGADEMASVVIRAEISGDYYLFGFEVARYGKAWYNITFIGEYSSYGGDDFFVGVILED
jgi:hypothetical protein